MATKPGGQSLRKRLAKLRQTIQSKIMDLSSLPNMAPPSLTGTGEVGASAIDLFELVREVTQNISKIVDQMFSKLTNALNKIASTLESQSKRINEADQRISATDWLLSSFASRRWRTVRRPWPTRLMMLITAADGTTYRSQT